MFVFDNINQKLDHVLRHLHYIQDQNDVIITAVKIDQPAIAEQVAKLNASREALLKALGNTPHAAFSAMTQETNMNPNLQALIDAVTAEQTIDASAVTFINGVPKLIADAVAAAVAGGATAAQLAPLNDLANQLKAQGAAITAAITANTPATP